MILLKSEKINKGGKYLSGDKCSFMEFWTLKSSVHSKDIP